MKRREWEEECLFVSVLKPFNQPLYYCHCNINPFLNWFENRNDREGQLSSVVWHYTFIW